MPRVIHGFNTSGTYVPTAGMQTCVIECIGGGGGGALQGPVGSYIYAIAAGGGSGGYSRTIATAADIGASQSVIIGVGGYANTSGQGPGGTTSLGTLCSANGGQPASGLSPGVGGSQSGAVGELTVPGAHGHGGFLSNNAYVQVVAGAGANSILGTGGAVPNGCVGTYTSGQPATFYGGGGGGATVGTSGGGGNAAGGAGYSGVVYITEYW
jgi:hypothetical protein